MFRLFVGKKAIAVSVVAFLVTAVAGYVSVLLISPQSRDETADSGRPRSYTQIASTPGPELACSLDPADVPDPAPDPSGRRPNYLHTCGNRILDSYGREFHVVGITWSGMEYEEHSPLGLYTRNWNEVLDQIARLSYNTIRLPYTNDMLQPGAQPQFINYELNPDLRGLSALEVLDRLVEGARQRGLKVILDRHRPTSAAQTPLWYTFGVPEDKWIEDWRMLAQHYAGNDTVIGADLHNEPHETATWGSGDRTSDWRLAAQRSGDAILEVNPFLLIFVQGIDRQGNDIYWWGGDLRGVSRHPVQLQIPNRVVYSPRDYGPEVYPQGYFSDPSFPNNLPVIWDEHWGYVHKQEIGPVVLGELGGTRFDDSVDGRWKRALLNYLEANRIGFINWALDRDAFDDPLALERDATTTIRDAGRRYRASVGIPDDQVEATKNPRATSLKALHKTTSAADKTDVISFAVKIHNVSSRPIDLSRIELRYWFTAGELGKLRQIAQARWASSSEQNVSLELVPAAPDGQQFYLKVLFGDSAGRIAPLSNSDEIQVEIRGPNRSSYIQSNDYSYVPNPEYQEWRGITLYLDGQMIWGVEP